MCLYDEQTKSILGFIRLRTPQVEKSLICNETIEGYLAAIKHLEILFGNSQNDSICGKMAAAPAVE